jgi:hypothetical protein
MFFSLCFLLIEPYAPLYNLFNGRDAAEEEKDGEHFNDDGRRETLFFAIK